MGCKAYLDKLEDKGLLMAALMVREADCEAEAVQVADSAVRQILGVPDSVYPKETDLLMRFWRCCRENISGGTDESAAAEV